jgi:hypothetical protein
MDGPILLTFPRCLIPAECEILNLAVLKEGPRAMKRSWREFFRRVASTCLMGVAGSSAWTSAVCYAINASDDASDPVYADGWLEGDNGGTGFTA